MGSIQDRITVGVLALQGAFSEHVQLLSQAFASLSQRDSCSILWTCIEVRTPHDLAKCDALIIPGGESTTMALVAARSCLLEPLRHFVKAERKPTWGTCAGLILLAEAANRTKKGGQELIGGLDVRVRRNHFGRQTESFEADISLPFLEDSKDKGFEESKLPFRGVFIRAPIVEKLLLQKDGPQEEEVVKPDTVIAPSRAPNAGIAPQISRASVEVMAMLPGRGAAIPTGNSNKFGSEVGDIIAVKQGNVFGTSFHPELTGDPRIHIWWLDQISSVIKGCQ